MYVFLGKEKEDFEFSVGRHFAEIRIFDLPFCCGNSYLPLFQTFLKAPDKHQETVCIRMSRY